MADTTARTAIFKGLNRMPYIGDGEMRDMRNLSSDAYPFITTRKGRKPYTFITKIPSPEGEAYKDVARLPEPCSEEMGNVYKLIENASEEDYISGEFYYWDEANGSWVQGIKDADFLGAVKEVLEYDRGVKGCTLHDWEYRVDMISSARDIYGRWGIDHYAENYLNKKYRYLGEDNNGFKFGKLYQYKINFSAVYFIKTDNYVNHDFYEGMVSELPNPSIELIGHSYMKEGELYYYYQCVADYNGYWEEVDEMAYEVVSQMPEAPEDGLQVRYINAPYGIPVDKGYYRCEIEMTKEDEYVYFYTMPLDPTEWINTYCLPVASEENVGAIYYYDGLKVGQFAKCLLNGESYEWQAVEHPLVERVVTLKDYLDNYDGCGLREIVEIGNFNGKIAALIIDGDGTYKLYCDEELWPVSNITDEPGKKLVTVGNRLVVGESGCSLYFKEIKDEEGLVTGKKNEYIEMGNPFSVTVRAIDYEYGEDNASRSEYKASGSAGGSANFVFCVAPNNGGRLKELYNGLKTPGTDFSVYSKRAGIEHKQYLTVTSITLQENIPLAGWVTGGSVIEEYATILEITATGVKESFNWYSEEGDYLYFESTDPHYYDVVAWKKRLWGYHDNIMCGSASDIFDSYGLVDWNRGDNTYLEAISQPLWQGGNITGVAALMNGLVYFKEDCITVVTGNYPAIMSSNTIPCRGLPPENRRSVAVANECVYYLSTDGVYRFDGNIPRCISRDVKISGTDAVGASDGNKYWISIKEESGEYALYVYDINYGIWHKEDNTNAASFAFLNGSMYMASGTDIFDIGTEKESVEWECEFWYDEGTYKNKKYKQFNVRGDIEYCELWLKADDNEWRFISVIKGNKATKITPFDCVELSLKLKGEGKCEIKSIDRVFEVIL